MYKYQEALIKLVAHNYSTRSEKNEYINTLQELVDKESKYQAIEEELGISLPILFKALKNGIYSRDYGWLFVEHFVLKMKEQLHCRPTYRKELRFAIKDYKKTWALSREDLNDE